MRKREIKNYSSVPFRFYPTHNRKFKKLKGTVMGLFRAQIGWKRPRMCENKSYHSVSFIPDTKYKISKKQKKKSKYKTIPLWLHFKPKQDGKGCDREKI